MENITPVAIGDMHEAKHERHVEMVDLHSHVLPGIDDGSRSVAESVAMMRASAEQGIRCMAATSHFYPFETTPERFLSRREQALERLSEALTPELPRLVLGAEVYYYEGISRSDQVDALRITGTPLLLLEMPFAPWTGMMVDEIIQLNHRAGVRVLMAHIERYLRFQKPQVWDTLLADGVLMQSNAEFFLSWKTSRKALRMLKSGRIHLMGSDCHNTDRRPPRMGEALARIGQEGRAILEQNIHNLALETLWLQPAL